MAPLYHRRKYLNEIERREQEGVSFWTDKFSEETRNRLQLAMRNSPGGTYHPLFEAATNLLLSDLGELRLYPNGGDAGTDLFRYLSECPDEHVPSVIEAFGQGYVRQFRENAQRRDFSEGIRPVDSSLPIDDLYVGEINRVLAEDRIAFEYLNGEMVPFSSRELHVEVVQPVLRLLATAGWEGVERSYQNALAELARWQGANAITDAGTALQEAFTFLGASGNQLGDLITSAKKLGIIASHDLPMLNTIDKACRWVSADRSNTGDTHNADEASNEDAWFTVHVVGAILLRLSSGEARGEAPGE